MTVVVTRNINQRMGLANGSRGRVVRLVLAEGCQVSRTPQGNVLSEPPVAVVLELETPAHAQVPGLPPRHRVVFLTRETGTVPDKITRRTTRGAAKSKGKGEAKGKGKAKRGSKARGPGLHYDYLAQPLRDARASTINSAQGLTMRNGIVLADIFGYGDWRRGLRPPKPPRQALFVALSRVPTLKHVLLLEKLTREDVDYCRPNQDDLDYDAFIQARSTSEETVKRFFWERHGPRVRGDGGDMVGEVVDDGQGRRKHKARTEGAGRVG